VSAAMVESDLSAYEACATDPGGPEEPEMPLLPLPAGLAVLAAGGLVLWRRQGQA
jgi:hypothetical protein